MTSPIVCIVYSSTSATTSLRLLLSLKLKIWSFPPFLACRSTIARSPTLSHPLPLSAMSLVRTLYHLRPTIQTRLSHTQPHKIYSNPRRLRSVGITSLAIAQASFWATATSLSHQSTIPLPPASTLLGFGLSAGFGALIAAYLKRTVAHIELLDGARVKVVAHSVAGLFSAPVIIDANELVPGPKADDPAERYWTFGLRGAGRTYFYIVDMKQGVLDRQALAAVAKGGEHLLVFSHKRDAMFMQGRWEQWQKSSNN